MEHSDEWTLSSTGGSALHASLPVRVCVCLHVVCGTMLFAIRSHAFCPSNGEWNCLSIYLFLQQHHIRTYLDLFTKANNKPQLFGIEHGDDYFNMLVLVITIRVDYFFFLIIKISIGIM